MNRDQGPPHEPAAEILRLRFTLDHVGAYVFTKDSEGRYTHANSMVCELFGHPLEDVIGKTDECFFELEASDDLRRNDLRVLRHGERIEGEERNIIAATGEERIYWTVKLPIRDDEGRITGLCGISTDITERLRLERELEKQKDLLSVVLENMDAYVYMKDRDRHYRYVNAKTADLYGMKADEVVGKLDEDMLPREIAEKFSVLDCRVIKGGKKAMGEEVVHGPDGREMTCWSIKIPLFKDGEVDGLIGFSTDISEVVKLRNEFHELARTDTLTGVLTRRFLIDHTEKALKRTQRRGAGLALLMIDIDHFKGINDAHGHAFGDSYILAIVDACRNSLRDGDLMGRLGGDEFVIVLDDTDYAGMETAAARFQQAIRATSLTSPDGQGIDLSVSIGAALSDASSTVDSLIAAADCALYQAKQEGRGCWRAAPVSA